MVDRPSGEDVLMELLDRAHLAAQDELPGLVAAAARSLGATDVAIFVVDSAQVVLVPLLVTGGEQQAPLRIDGTVAGRAFQRVETQIVEEPDGVRFWFPLLDGTDRLGVLAVLLPAERATDEHTPRKLRGLADLAAELFRARAECGDTFTMAARRKDMSIAAEIQWQLLPSLTFATRDVLITGAVEPCYSVGGDGFDYAVDGSVARFAVFDAMGHGLQASLLCVTAVSAYRNARRAGLDLIDTLLATDRAVAHAFDEEKFVTAVLAELDLRTGRVRAVVAGHPDPLVIRGGRVARTLGEHRTIPLGLGVGDVVVMEEDLQPGDRLLLYTDGVVEARDEHGDFFGLRRLVDFVSRESSTGAAAPEVMRRLMQAVLRHQHGVLQDDATQVFVEWRGGHERRLLVSRP
jgi:serine phosphatase RsbU (regulator of sigma subunit)